MVKVYLRSLSAPRGYQRNSSIRNNNVISGNRHGVSLLNDKGLNWNTFTIPRRPTLRLATCLNLRSSYSKGLNTSGNGIYFGDSPKFGGQEAINRNQPQTSGHPQGNLLHPSHPNPSKQGFRATLTPPCLGAPGLRIVNLLATSERPTTEHTENLSAKFSQLRLHSQIQGKNNG
jgi:hypothetical protein